MDIAQIYFDKYGITNVTDNNRSWKKEEVGDSIIKEENLFVRFFPDMIGYKKITTKKLQKAGADYIIYFEDRDPIYIDIKVNIGSDYSMKPEDYIRKSHYVENEVALPIEIYQNKIFTNEKSKITDYMLYFILEEKRQICYLIDYIEIFKVSAYHCNFGKQDMKRFTLYRSNNKSGIYIKTPTSYYNNIRKYVLNIL